MQVDEQQKPLKIASLGIWDNDPKLFKIQDLTNTETQITRLTTSVEHTPFPALGVSQSELNDLDKYDLDVQSLIEAGYSFYTNNA